MEFICLLRPILLEFFTYPSLRKVEKALENMAEGIHTYHQQFEGFLIEVQLI